MRTVYLDNNATTQPAPAVIEAMLPFFREHWGNPSSMHAFGGRVKKYVETARAQVAALIGAEPAEILFTSGGTESDNMAIRGAVEAFGGRAHVITSRVEHPAVLEPCRWLAGQGHALTEIDVDSEGQLNLAQLRGALGEGRCVASIMWANNETGVVFPIDEIAAMVKASGGVLHTDAVQAAGKLPIDVRRTNCTRPRALARYTSGRAPRSCRSCSAATRRAASAAGRRTCRTSWGWVKPASWRSGAWPGRQARRPPCVTGSKPACCGPARTPG